MFSHLDTPVSLEVSRDTFSIEGVMTLRDDDVLSELVAESADGNCEGKATRGQSSLMKEEEMDETDDLGCRA